MNLPPIDEREDGMEVLAFHRGKWRHVKWSANKRQFHLGYGEPFILESDRPFAELPPRPEGAGGFYDWKE
jgi:hypothetical protein